MSLCTQSPSLSDPQGVLTVNTTDMPFHGGHYRQRYEQLAASIDRVNGEQKQSTELHRCVLANSFWWEREGVEERGGEEWRKGRVKRGFPWRMEVAHTGFILHSHTCYTQPSHGALVSLSPCRLQHRKQPPPQASWVNAHPRNLLTHETIQETMLTRQVAASPNASIFKGTIN